MIIEISNEDWKEGKLEEGEYYVKTTLGERPIRVDTYTVLGIKDNKPVMGFLRYEDDVVEVLAPCDYDELQCYKEFVNLYNQETKATKKLYAVLEECKDFFYMYPTSEIESGDLYRKVIDILGEDSE